MYKRYIIEEKKHPNHKKESAQMNNEKANKGNRFAKWLRIFLTLFITWIILSEIFEVKFIFYAIISCAIIAAICLRTMHISGVKSGKDYFLFSHNLPRFINYFFWIVWQIILAAWDVSKVTLFHREDIDPRTVWFKVEYDNPLAISMLANSITLTPGTITIDVTDGIFAVHALTQGAADGLLDGSMQAKVAWLYGEPTTCRPINVGRKGGTEC